MLVMVNICLFFIIKLHLPYKWGGEVEGIYNMEKSLMINVEFPYELFQFINYMPNLLFSSYPIDSDV